MTNRLYDFALPATLNASQRLDVRGSVLRIVNSPAGYVGVKLDTGAEVVLLPGQGFRMPPGKEFRDVTLRNIGGTANTGSVFIGDLSFEDARITGIVEMVDGERVKVGQGVCFSGVAEVVGAAGAPRLQVWNPAASGRLIYVTAVTLGAALADQWGMTTNTTQLPTAGGNVPTNHDSTGPAAVALMRIDNTGAALTGSRVFRAGYLPATTDRIVVLPRPVLVRPGMGAMVYCNNVGNTMRASFEFEEWPA